MPKVPGQLDRAHPEVLGGHVWAAAGCQPAVQQTNSLRYGVAPIVNRPSNPHLHPRRFRGLPTRDTADSQSALQTVAQIGNLPYRRLAACVPLTTPESTWLDPAGIARQT
jgi:hypothetical protein